MRFLITVALAAAVGAITAPPAPAQTTMAGPAIVGTWNGTYDGEGAGTYSMTVTADPSTGLGGSLQVNPGEGGYDVTFTSVVAEGRTATLKYDSPEGGEVQIDVTVDGDGLTGAWKAFEAGTTTVVATGTLSGKRS